MATGHTDVQKRFASLSLQAQEVLRRDPAEGAAFFAFGDAGASFCRWSGMTAKEPACLRSGWNEAADNRERHYGGIRSGAERPPQFAPLLVDVLFLMLLQADPHE
jgi:hypothetical protein